MNKYLNLFLYITVKEFHLPGASVTESHEETERKEGNYEAEGLEAPVSAGLSLTLLPKLLFLAVIVFI